MSLNSDMRKKAPPRNKDREEKVWKALSDNTRREILDLLRLKDRTTGEICQHFASLTRTGVMKHLDILEQATLILVRREGRFRWNQLNPAPIQQICERWIEPHIQMMTHSVLRLKQQVEQAGKDSADESNNEL